jgi:hypothetical protein
MSPSGERLPFRYILHLFTLLNQSLLLSSPDRPYAPFPSRKVHQCPTGVTAILYLVLLSAADNQGRGFRG